jgi:hypothetical protein
MIAGDSEPVGKDAHHRRLGEGLDETYGGVNIGCGPRDQEQQRHGQQHAGRHQPHVA